MLTKQQSKALKFINEKLKHDGFSPSYKEIGDAIGVSARSSVHQLVLGLEERGFIRRIPYRKRAIEVIKIHSEMCARG
jgi:repressor LexA